MSRTAALQIQNSLASPLGTVQLRVVGFPGISDRRYLYSTAVAPRRPMPDRFRSGKAGAMAAGRAAVGKRIPPVGDRAVPD